MNEMQMAKPQLGSNGAGYAVGAALKDGRNMAGGISPGMLSLQDIPDYQGAVVTRLHEQVLRLEDLLVDMGVMHIEPPSPAPGHEQTGPSGRQPITSRLIEVTRTIDALSARLARIVLRCS